MKKFKNIFINSRGQSLVYAMVFLTITTATLLAIQVQSNHTKNINIQKAADEDVQVASTSILSFLSNGGNCNANFYNRGNIAQNNITTIYSCSSGSCHGSGATSYYSGGIPDWDPQNTKISNRLRFAKYDYRVAYTAPGHLQRCVLKIDDTTPASPCNPGDNSQHGIPSVLEITLYFEKRINSKTVNDSTGAAFKTVSSKIYIPIVTDSLNPPTIIKGCSIDANSTVLY